MSGSKRGSSAAPRVITDLLSSRLHNLAGLSAASASLRVQRKFNLTLLEWRSIGMLGAHAPLSLKELARRAALDKSYASRTVSGLIERGLVASERSDADARAVLLSLTKAGDALYRKVIVDANARNERLLSPLSTEQRSQLMEMLAALTVSARSVLEDERRAASGETIDEDEPAATGTSPADSGNSDGLDLAEIRALVSRLNRLVGGN
ncbi:MULTISPECIES: MarR family winged helix-turn-helix transcriptional regulator [unclassified Cupriavidus]|uniref:MarR family winged helix-turn-helix transcriptional regulator n=1 Tax=unclassified Cupriavidus TaxID=2640874 RepID=UPI00088125E1|nr:MarR family transcriptional regulator [Cupriavidus sp. YR651]SDC97306.1 DNA-binding transcriptional regulator, MarR family [Cupriavidus sp. YR651]